MSRLLRFAAALYQDGFKALGIFAPLLSIAFTVAKAFGFVDALKHISYAWALLPTALWLLVAYARRWAAFDDQVEAPRPSPLQLTQMSITDVAEYVLNQSSWGWRKRQELTLKRIVKDHVAWEMTLAGREYRVRYIGAPPNSDTTVEISRTYWQYAKIDDNRVWDRRNRFFTEVTRAGVSVVGGAFCYQFGAAPKIDVARAWPKASLAFKTRVLVLVWGRKLWAGFPNYLREAPDDATQDELLPSVGSNDTPSSPMPLTSETLFAYIRSSHIAKSLNDRITRETGAKIDSERVETNSEAELALALGLTSIQALDRAFKENEILVLRMAAFIQPQGTVSAAFSTQVLLYVVGARRGTIELQKIFASLKNNATNPGFAESLVEYLELITAHPEP